MVPWKAFIDCPEIQYLYTMEIGFSTHFCILPFYDERRLKFSLAFILDRGFSI